MSDKISDFDEETLAIGISGRRNSVLEFQCENREFIDLLTSKRKEHLEMLEEEKRWPKAPEVMFEPDYKRNADMIIDYLAAMELKREQEDTKKEEAQKKERWKRNLISVGTWFIGILTALFVQFLAHIFGLS